MHDHLFSFVLSSTPFHHKDTSFKYLSKICFQYQHIYLDCGYHGYNHKTIHKAMGCQNFDNIVALMLIKIDVGYQISSLIRGQQKTKHDCLQATDQKSSKPMTSLGPPQQESIFKQYQPNLNGSWVSVLKPCTMIKEYNILQRAPESFWFNLEGKWQPVSRQRMKSLEKFCLTSSLGIENGQQ